VSTQRAAAIIAQLAKEKSSRTTIRPVSRTKDGQGAIGNSYEPALWC
jgi:hypothetical protein